MFALNITLLIQVVHFIIAYVLIRKFLFAPAVSVIMAQESAQDELISHINSLHQDISYKNELAAQRKKECADYCRMHAPDYLLNYLGVQDFVRVSSLEIAQLNISEIEKAQKELANSIIAMVDHVR